MTLSIKVMHDYESHPLWRARRDEPSDNVAPEELGLSPSLCGRLSAWTHWGESRVNLADPHDSRRVAAVEDAAFDAEGRLLAGRVSDELPNASVHYWRDAAPRD